MQDHDALWNELSAIRAEDIDVKSLVDEKTFSVLDRLWRTGHAEGRPVNPTGGMGEGKCAALIAATRVMRPMLSLEVGFANASSGVSILGACADQTPRQHIAIDPNQTRLYDQNGIKNVTFIGAKARLQVIEYESCLALPYLMQQRTGVFDLILIDGLHRFDETLLEWFYCDRLLKIGGLIIFDDLKIPAVTAVVNFVEANRPYRIRRLDQHMAFAQKTDHDRREWYDFTEFAIPAGGPYKERTEARLRARAEKTP